MRAYFQIYQPLTKNLHAPTPSHIRSLPSATAPTSQCLYTVWQTSSFSTTSQSQARSIKGSRKGPRKDPRISLFLPLHKSWQLAKSLIFQSFNSLLSPTPSHPPTSPFLPSAYASPLDDSSRRSTLTPPRPR